MKIDREQKRARLGEHIPDFPGYSALNLGETDLQLRRLLAGEMEKVRDRLAGFMAGGGTAGLEGEFAETLRATALVREKFLPQEEGYPAGRDLSPVEEEGLFDLDLALLERVAALNSPLDRMETVTSADELAAALAFFDQGLTEIGELFRRRREILRPAGEGGRRT